MAWADPEPWLPAALALLDARRQDRVLACGIGVAGARQLASAVGRDGQLVLVMDDAGRARVLAALDLAHVRILAHPLAGDERFGAFDAALFAQATGPVLPLGAFADLARNNLRPGGRLVVDVPAAIMVPVLATACAEAGLGAERTVALRGVDDGDLADALRNAGLRDVHASAASSPLAIAAGDLVGGIASLLSLSAKEQLELTHALGRRLRGTGPADVMLHRARVTARR